MSGYMTLNESLALSGPQLSLSVKWGIKEEHDAI